MHTRVPDLEGPTGVARADTGVSAGGTDPFCILVWRFTAEEGRIDDLVTLCEEASVAAREQPKCLFQRYTRCGSRLQVHAGFEDSFGALTHVISFSETLKHAREISRLEGLEVHGTGAELALLREPLAAFGPLYFERSLEEAV